MAKVSVIVPFHNVEKYISKCLTSLIYQSLDDIEIICINDASNDDSKNIVQHYMGNDERIILLNVENMSGQSYARNLGLEVASGEYIGFVDSDDWVELDMYEKMYNKAKSVDSDITMCQAQLYDDKEQTFYTNDYYSLKSLEKYGDNVFNPYETKDEILNINVVFSQGLEELCCYSAVGTHSRAYHRNLCNIARYGDFASLQRLANFRKHFFGFFSIVFGNGKCKVRLAAPADILDNSPYEKMVAERYASYDQGEGKAFEEGRLTLEQVAEYARTHEPVQRSGKQELYEAILNMYC